MLSAYPDATELKEVAQNFLDLEITRDESIAAGNCASGTDEFLEEYFQKRTSVKVSALVSYIDHYQGVRTVLEYKFRQLEQQAEEKSEE